MKCDEFTQWLQNQLDERKPVVFSKQTRQHLSECPVCRDQLHAWKQIASILPVHHELNTIEAVVRDRSYAPWPACLAIASAAVLVFVLLSPPWFPPATEVASSSQAKKTLDPEFTPLSQPLNQSSAIIDLDGSGDVADNHFHRPVAKQTGSTIDPSSWWQNVQERDWINRTLDNTKPTVESMRNGVAPLGRSLVIAVTLLTRIGGDQTS